MNLIINNGTGDTDDNGWEQAYSNIQQYIKDCEIELHIVKSEHISKDDGRYRFFLESYQIPDYEVEVDIPSLSIEKVRFLGLKEQDVWQFPRLYVDGSSWLWKFAIITKDNVKNYLEDKIENLKYELENTEKLLEKFCTK